MLITVVEFENWDAVRVASSVLLDVEPTFIELDMAENVVVEVLILVPGGEFTDSVVTWVLLLNVASKLLDICPVPVLEVCISDRDGLAC